MAGKKQTQTPEEKLAQALVPQDQQPYALPKGWVWTRVGNIAKKISDGSHNPPPNNFNGIPLLSAANIHDNRINFEESTRWITENQWIEENKRTVLEINDVLLTIVGTLGRTAVVETANKFALQRSVAVIKPQINSKFLAYYLESPFIQNYMANNAKGTAQKGFYLNKVALLSIPLPPLPEQQRIVARIESLFAKLDAAREKLQQVVDTQEARKAAILHEAFTGRLTGHKGSAECRGKSEEGSSQNPEGPEFVPEGWQATSAKNLFQYVTSGSRGWAKYYADKGALFIRMGNLKHGTIQPDFTDKQFVHLPDKAEGQRSLVQDHDILISITADVGMIGYIEHMGQEAYINQHIALARPVHPEQGKFIAWYLVSDIGFQQLKRKQRGATKVGLGLDDIRNLVLYMPPIEEQNMIVHKIETLLEKEKAIHDIVQSSLSQIDLLKKSILARAFRGELGTQDPSDPDARELLL